MFFYYLAKFMTTIFFINTAIKKFFLSNSSNQEIPPNYYKSVIFKNPELTLKQLKHSGYKEISNPIIRYQLKTVESDKLYKFGFIMR